MKYVILMLAIGLAAAALAACSSERETAPPPTTRLADPSDRSDSGEAIGPELMIALGQAKNFHHKAKVYMSDGKLDDAVASVREILSLRFPAGAAEADDVRNDARAGS